MLHDYELITTLLPEANNQWNPFNDVYLLSKFDVSSFSVTEDNYIFKLVILLTLSSSKLIFILLTLGKSKLTLFGPFTDCGQVTVILLSSGKTCCKKQFKPPFDKNSRTTHIIRSGTSHFPWFNQQQSRTGFL